MDASTYLQENSQTCELKLKMLEPWDTKGGTMVETVRGIVRAKNREELWVGGVGSAPHRYPSGKWEKQ